MWNARRLAAACAAAACFVASHHSLAQQPSRTSATYEDWTVQCVQQNNARSCEVNQIQQAPGQSGPASEVEIRQLPGGKSARITIQVPPNLAVGQGVRLVLEGHPGKDNKADQIGKPVMAPVRFCVATRCLAEVDVSDEQIRSMLRAESGLIVVNQADQREASVRFSFKGFPAAWRHAQRENGAARP